jgi:hypothetical protein
VVASLFACPLPNRGGGQAEAQASAETDTTETNKAQDAGAPDNDEQQEDGDTALMEVPVGTTKRKQRVAGQMVLAVSPGGKSHTCGVFFGT